MNLSVALQNRENGVHHVSLFYDATPTEGKSLSHVLDLESVEHFELDDTYCDRRQLELRGLMDLRLYRDPGFLTTLMYRLKWWLEDREARKAAKT